MFRGAPIVTATASFAILTALVAHPRPAIANPIYSVTDLGTVPDVSPTANPGDYPIIPESINSSGQIVGKWEGIPSGSTGIANGAFLYVNGHMSDVTATGANGLGINDSGTMTRASDVGINNSGITVGWGANSYINTNGQRIDLPTTFVPTAISDTGVVTGSYGPNGQAAVYAAGSVITFGPSNGDALGINKSGEVVGFASSGVLPTAFYWNGSDFHFLGNANTAISSGTRAINNAGQIVGSITEANGTPYAFLSLAGSSAVDLNTLILKQA